MTARIYVGTYAKYNEGNLFGKWLNLEDYTDRDDFYEACAELHEDEDDPEFMFQDWEDIPSSMVSESHIDSDFWDVLDAYNTHGEDAVNAYLALFDTWDIQSFEDQYIGQYDDWEDYASSWLEESGELDSIPEHLQMYFDYEAYARDLRINADVVEHDGYFFRNY